MAASIMIGTSSSNLVDVPVDPDAISWGLQDISAADAGRVNDATNRMYKMRTSQKRKMQLSWTDVSFADAHAILVAVNPEYIWVRYKDPLSGSWDTRQFYVGDRSAPYRQISIADATGRKTVMQTLQFDLIEV